MSKTITISDETFESIKDQLGCDEKVDVSSLEDMVGKKWFFRTVTYHITGEVTKVIGKIVQLKDAAWVADSGRFMDAIKKGILKEVEPLDIWFVNLDSCTDFGPWKHKLPKEQI